MRKLFQAGRKALPILLGQLALVVFSTISVAQTPTPEVFEQSLVEAYHSRYAWPPASSPLQWNVLAGIVERERARQAEQLFIVHAVTCYMDVLFYSAKVYLYTKYTASIETEYDSLSQQQSTSLPYLIGLANLELRRVAAHAAEQLTRSMLKAKVAEYQRLFGIRPKVLGPGRPINKGLPPSLAEATRIAQEESPAIRAALATMLLARASAKGQPEDGRSKPDIFPPAERPGTSTFQKVSGPLYNSGVIYGRARAADRLYSFERARLDQERQSVQEAVAAAWASYRAAEAAVERTDAEATGFERVLDQVESKVPGVDDSALAEARRQLLAARIALIEAQRDRVVASYALMAAIGRLSVKLLGIPAGPLPPSREARANTARSSATATAN